MLRRMIVSFLFSMILFSLSPVAGAGVDVDFNLGVTASNDDLFLRINANFFDRDPDFVVRLAKRLPVPDIDLPIVLFLAHHSGRNLDLIIDMHKKGLSWWDVSLRLGIPVRIYFMDFPFDPGPPYGKAYGYWKKHRRNPKYRILLSDRELYDLVTLQVACKYYGLPPRDVIQLRQAGKDFKIILAEEYKHRHIYQKEKAKEHREKEKEKHGKKK
ncbi:MAG: hypothetical protein AB1756_00120 [Acidobacteriota bacterium]